MLKRTNWTMLAAVGCLLLTLAGGASLALAVDAETASQGEPGQSASAKRAKLDGAKVYAWNCGSCHSERWPKERSDAEWEMIMTHMRVRANMTAAQTEAVLRYLEENN